MSKKSNILFFWVVMQSCVMYSSAVRHYSMQVTYEKLLQLKPAVEHFQVEVEKMHHVPLKLSKSQAYHKLLEIMPKIESLQHMSRQKSLFYKDATNIHSLFEKSSKYPVRAKQLRHQQKTLKSKKDVSSLFEKSPTVKHKPVIEHEHKLTMHHDKKGKRYTPSSSIFSK